MSRPMVRIHDLATDTITDREMTDEEFAQHEANQAADAALKVAEAEAKAAAQAKLTALGLTVEDLQALGL